MTLEAATASTLGLGGQILLGAALALVAITQQGDGRKADEDDERRHRGRIQIQGSDLGSFAEPGEKKDTPKVLQYAWNLPFPLPAAVAVEEVRKRQSLLIKQQLARRAQAFEKLFRFILQAQQSGGSGPTPPLSFFNNKRDPRFPDARVDLQVHAGIAFHP